jgi:hypothetical protein
MKTSKVLYKSSLLIYFHSISSGLSAEKLAQLMPKSKLMQGDSPGLPALLPVAPEYGGEDYYPYGIDQPILLEDSEAIADAAKWQGYMEELMTKFPEARQEPETPVIPPEVDGTGLNRRAFYICNYLGGPWILLPSVTPAQVNGSREIRWCLTGDLDAPIRTYPIYPGKEAHYLKALLARAAAGSLVSPKGFYKPLKFSGEYDGEDDEYLGEDEDSMNG